MKINESGVDRIVRVVLGVAALGFGWSLGTGGWLGILLLVIGAIMLLTGIVGFCPLYTLLKFSTKKA
jgi:hypothetical protein